VSHHLVQQWLVLVLVPSFLTIFPAAGSIGRLDGKPVRQTGTRNFPSPLLGKGGTNYGVKELALFPPMAKLHMIDVNPKQLLKH
jgi:hypothetical protein